MLQCLNALQATTMTTTFKSPCFTLVLVSCCFWKLMNGFYITKSTIQNHFVHNLISKTILQGVEFSYRLRLNNSHHHDICFVGFDFLWRIIEDNNTWSWTRANSFLLLLFSSDRLMVRKWRYKSTEKLWLPSQTMIYLVDPNHMAPNYPGNRFLLLFYFTYKIST